MSTNVRHHRKLYRREDSGVWWAIYYDAAGRRRRESTRCTDRTAAEQWLKDKERQATAPGGSRRSVPSLSIEDAARAFLQDQRGVSDATWEVHECKSRHIRQLLGHFDVNDLEQADIVEYTRRREADVSRHTVYKELMALRGILNYAAKVDIFQGSLERLMPSYSANYRPRRTWLSPEQYAALRNQLQPHRQRWTDVVVCLGGTRLSECEKVRWEHFDWENRQVLIQGTKTKHALRYVPIPEQFYDTYYPVREREGQFAASWGKVTRDLAAACARADVPKCSPNDLRRTYGSWLIQAGVDIRRVAALMGTSVAMVEMVYGQFSLNSMREAVSALPSVPDYVAPAAPKPTVAPSRFSLLEVD